MPEGTSGELPKKSHRRELQENAERMQKEADIMLADLAKSTSDTDRNVAKVVRQANAKESRDIRAEEKWARMSESLPTDYSMEESVADRDRLNTLKSQMSDRRAEVVDMMLAGNTIKEIAEKFDVSPTWVVELKQQTLDRMKKREQYNEEQVARPQAESRKPKRKKTIKYTYDSSKDLGPEWSRESNKQPVVDMSEGEVSQSDMESEVRTYPTMDPQFAREDIRRQSDVKENPPQQPESNPPPPFDKAYAKEYVKPNSSSMETNTPPPFDKNNAREDTRASQHKVEQPLEETWQDRMTKGFRRLRERIRKGFGL